jgi:hypothetical protein
MSGQHSTDAGTRPLPASVLRSAHRLDDDAAVREIDVNPVIIGSRGAVAIDWLIVAATDSTR